MAQEITAAHWLAQVREIAVLLDKAAQSILVLSAKRSTLEERSISSYLHRLIAEYGRILFCAHRLLVENKLPPGSILPELADVTAQAAGALDDLLKAARYDPNYLEQYFEYDFNSRLNSQYRFLDKVGKISASLAALKGPTDQL